MFSGNCNFLLLDLKDKLDKWSILRANCLFLKSLENFPHWHPALRIDYEMSKASVTSPRKIFFSWLFSFLENPLYMCFISFSASQTVVCSAIFSSLAFYIVWLLQALTLCPHIVTMYPHRRYVCGHLGHTDLNCSHCGFHLSNIFIFSFHSFLNSATFLSFPSAF